MHIFFALYVARLCEPGKTSHFFFASHPIHYPRNTLALPPSSKSDPGSHSGPFFPLPNEVRAFNFFFREKKSAFSSLVDSRRIGSYILPEALLKIEKRGQGTGIDDATKPIGNPNPGPSPEITKRSETDQKPFLLPF